jgi:hypothetical protein
MGYIKVREQPLRNMTEVGSTTEQQQIYKDPEWKFCFQALGLTSFFAT